MPQSLVAIKRSYNYFFNNSSYTTTLNKKHFDSLETKAQICLIYKILL